jgi:hypothetical protein
MPECGICGNELMFIGGLGWIDFYRCRGCGMQFGFDSGKEEKPDERSG